MTIHINDLLPKDTNIIELKTEAELLLAYELRKYTRQILNEDLSLANITISKRLYETEHFSFVYTKGLKIEGNLDHTNPLKDYSEIESDFFQTDMFLFDIAFKHKDDGYVVYDYNYNTDKNRVLHKDNRSTAYISLVAMLLVEDYINKRENPRKLIIDHHNYQHTEDEYVELLILQNYGNRILSKDILEIRYNNNGKPQAEWVSYIYHQRRMGNMLRQSTVSNKYDYLRKNFEVGDAVLLYELEEKKSKRSEKHIKSITSCYPATIQNYNDKEISLFYYTPISTKVTRAINLIENNKDPYDHEETLKIKASPKKLLLDTVGIDHYMSTSEESLILRPIDLEGNPIDHDGTEQYFKIDGQYKRIWLNTIETIYAVYKDQGIKFNDDRFKSMYFGDRTPFYDQIKINNQR